MEDSRFSKFSTDPKYRNVPKKQRKVKIDERFQSMFKDKKFVSKVSVDKRGRPGNFSTKENFEKFYHLDSSDDEDDEEEKEDTKDMGTAVKDPNVDYARGEAVLSDSSSEEEEEEQEDSSDSDEEVTDKAAKDEDFDKWGELDHDAEETEEATKRLAVCNMDWDRVGADDLYLALSSFCPPGGRLLKVSVYVSEFGKKRLAEEDQLGPVELRGDSKRKKESEAEAMERIRKYQVNRLKYYYAVAEFNSAIAANRVYTQCDGNEYELSATRFDLRFIPDEMEFQDDGPPRDTCDAPPDPDKYKPKFFASSALSLGKVDLTWDETDPDRVTAMQKAFEDDDDEKLKAYFANSSDEDENEDDNGPQESDEDFGVEKDEDVIAKYRALLGEQSEKVEEMEGNNEDSDDDGTGMEMTYIPDEDKRKENEALKVEQMTPWEKYLHKKKEKRKQKKERSEKKEVIEDEDDIPDDVKNDPFFQEELKARKPSKKAETKKSGDDKEDYSLLVMDSDDDKAHFDYKEIVKKSTLSKKKEKKRKRKNSETAANQDDDFQMDLKDPRFAAIFHNPKYNVDPSHPGFKKTKAMKSIIEEKQHRIISKHHGTGEGISTEQTKEEQPRMKKSKPSILSLADSVAMKTSNKKGKRRKK